MPVDDVWHPHLTSAKMVLSSLPVQPMNWQLTMLFNQHVSVHTSHWNDKMCLSAPSLCVDIFALCPPPQHPHSLATGRLIFGSMCVVFVEHHDPTPEPGVAININRWYSECQPCLRPFHFTLVYTVSPLLLSFNFSFSLTHLFSFFSLTLGGLTLECSVFSDSASTHFFTKLRVLF